METGRVGRTVYELTPLGRDWLEKGSPEERIVDFLRQDMYDRVSFADSARSLATLLGPAP